MPGFRWSEKANTAAVALAEGQSIVKAADMAGVNEKTIRRWMAMPEFAEEVDRLTFLTGIANKAYRLRMAKRVIVALAEKTNKDLLEWLKFAQSETDGTKLDLTGLFAALTEDASRLAGGGQGGPGAPADGEEAE